MKKPQQEAKSTLWDECDLDNTPEGLGRDIKNKLFCMVGKFPEVATRNNYYLALAYAVRDRLLHNWVHTAKTYFDNTSRTVVYLSAEFLIGPQLGRNLVSLGIYQATAEALKGMGQDLDDLIEQEEEPGLGNGGLGRLAACYMESLATLRIPTIGYGIRYEFGIFDQEIQDGWQVEKSDRWLRLGYPWEINHPEVTFEVKLGGHTEPFTNDQGRYGVRWIPHRIVLGTPCDTLMQGYGVKTVNMLRLWKAEAHDSFDFQAFNVGDYYRAVNEKVVSENITKVLYPNDEPAAGKQLRLEQQYFFVSCALRDMIRIHTQRAKSLDNFHQKYAVQLNDTHPAIGVAELMRLLVDEHGMDWDQAWSITHQTFAYTNHTLLPEALEQWPLPLFQRVLPRHLEIIYEINQRFLAEVADRWPDDPARLRRLSLIDERGDKYIRMAHLACVGSSAINGVAALHTELLKATVLRDFYALWPDKFTNKTNGVTPRRFLALANPGLAKLITSRIGSAWVSDLDQLRGLEPFATDPDFQMAWQQVKHANKVRLAGAIRASTGIKVDPDSLFDIQVKRIHEYKRQHLNLLHVLTLYHRLKQNPSARITPRTVIFGGKAAPAYATAKLIIKLINAVAAVINTDPESRDQLRVVFFPDFNVKNSQHIYPAADLSEQISTAGKEASGTGNMKFSMNGALTIGTLDGANVEIREEVGAENFFLFGLTAAEVEQRKWQGYHPRALYEQNAELRAVLDLIESGTFSPEQPGLFQPLVNALLERDDYLLLADYSAYIEAQENVSHAYLDQADWTRRSILNVARMGKFSSDRAIREYCRDIWHVEPVAVK
ncbi:MAG: glycogen/starch/alpha-glucan phosphorylase [Cephaloticoccus sp.]|nr:glycogen/starch/alpha-glucan phosphorylase [Cephaloticoccus sp.]MCF7759224.1 glycogen/starch/alpha-glucan phosphorylase [Cephaloticoccus sp.]